jgi:hypothetical protein
MTLHETKGENEDFTLKYKRNAKGKYMSLHRDKQNK